MADDGFDTPPMSPPMSPKSCASTITLDLLEEMCDTEQITESFALHGKAKQLRREKLLRFLKKHGFAQDVNEPRLPGCTAWFTTKKEVVYPIHVAAQLGDCQTIRALLAEGADPTKKTSKGRTAADFIKECTGPRREEAARMLRA
eukprot:CAMPEP_0181418458 /NCGR_PEP_ID=MMETSP1110-20121109/11571_1 /TAXON_ID=174948 /ORGANISM="Symbiodinium sp., Strain CCMP421" /LENGTH=144 /DNA_ID=CAMNT_0023541449 /DNA_START=70 /DNA_END=504 /DNA_ORIENTATION=-